MDRLKKFLKKIPYFISFINPNPLVSIKLIRANSKTLYSPLCKACCCSRMCSLWTAKHAVNRSESLVSMLESVCVLGVVSVFIRRRDFLLLLFLHHHLPPPLPLLLLLLHRGSSSFSPCASSHYTLFPLPGNGAGDAAREKRAGTKIWRHCLAQKAKCIKFSLIYFLLRVCFESQVPARERARDSTAL